MTLRISNTSCLCCFTFYIWVYFIFFSFILSPASMFMSSSGFLNFLFLFSSFSGVLSFLFFCFTGSVSVLSYSSCFFSILTSACSIFTVSSFHHKSWGHCFRTARHLIGYSRTCTAIGSFLLMFFDLIALYITTKT